VNRWGPQPSDAKFVCPDCGKVRFYHPSGHRKSARCNSCAVRHRHQQRKKMMMADQRNRLPFAVKVRIADAVRAAVEPDGDKYVKYRDGFSDAILAERLSGETGTAIAETAITTVRREVAGKFRKRTPDSFRAPKGNTYAKDAARVKREEIDAIRAQVEILTERVAALEKPLVGRANRFSAYGQSNTYAEAI
jgi:transcription elongation factor Elf1